jgi:hypothetical protein
MPFTTNSSHSPALPNTALNYTMLSNATVAALNATTATSPSPIQIFPTSQPARGAPMMQTSNTSISPHQIQTPSPVSLNRTIAKTLDPNSTAPPRSGLTTTPTVPLARESQTPAISKSNHVLVRSFYIAYRAPDAQAAPTPLEFEEMRRRTEIYYSAFLASMFANSSSIKFEGLKTKLNATAFGNEASEQTDNFNIYMQYQYVDILFHADRSQPLGADETFEILKSGITVEYILQVVRTMAGTPFESTIEVLMSSA